MIGSDIYEKLIKGYTEKQWGRSATDLPPFIIKRLPVRLTFDNNYFNDRYQGIPIGGYNVIIENMMKDVEVELGLDFFANRQELEASAEKVVFTGMIDQYFDYKHGELEYRSLRFEHKVLHEENYQGNAVVNYTEREIPYTLRKSLQTASTLPYLQPQSSALSLTTASFLVCSLLIFIEYNYQKVTPLLFSNKLKAKQVIDRKSPAFCINGFSQNLKYLHKLILMLLHLIQDELILHQYNQVQYR
ncbi:UDP-galactopyranose mutase [Streptococcus pneumoniae]|nr:UDP-galactopyranose mutase [Streptococcus pneumoniae]